MSHQKNVGPQGSPLCPCPSGPGDTGNRDKFIFGKRPWGQAQKVGMRGAKKATSVKWVPPAVVLPNPYSTPCYSVCTESFLSQWLYIILLFINVCSFCFLFFKILYLCEEMVHARNLRGCPHCPADLTHVGRWLPAGMGPLVSSIPVAGTCGQGAAHPSGIFLLPRRHIVGQAP